MDVIDGLGITHLDTVIGIASSGRTPFVWGTLYRAKQLGAFTSIITFNPHLTFQFKPHERLVVNIGAEILTGSTRLKSGSATKCILNMITTLAMVRIGKVYENLMIDVAPSNEKLKERAMRICLTLLQNILESYGDNEEEKTKFKRTVREVLEANGFDIRKTVEDIRARFES